MHYAVTRTTDVMNVPEKMDRTINALMSKTNSHVVMLFNEKMERESMTNSFGCSFCFTFYFQRFCLIKSNVCVCLMIHKNRDWMITTIIFQ